MRDEDHSLRRKICSVPIAIPLAGGAPLSAWCAEQQSALNPKSIQAELVAELWWAMLIVGALILLAVIVLLLRGVFRSKGRELERSLSNRQSWTLVIIGGVVIPIIILFTLVISSFYVGRVVHSEPPKNALTVEVIGRLWWWEIHYLDKEGRRIMTTANEIHIPLGKPVRFLLKSPNVIHSFWVPNLQGKIDLVPGQTNTAWLQATETGVYRGQCAEFCGAQHANMAFLVIVESADEYAAWLERLRQPAAPPTDPTLIRGRDAFLSRGCADCHTIRGTPASGEVGPDLTHIGGRRTLAAATILNTRGHLGGWIADPQNVKPGNVMPSTALPPEDLNALLSYLQSLE